jgi:hypothetical protein
LSGPEPVKCEDLNYKELIVIKGRLFAATALLAVAGCVRPAFSTGLEQSARPENAVAASLRIELAAVAGTEPAD